MATAGMSSGARWYRQDRANAQQRRDAYEITCIRPGCREVATQGDYCRHDARTFVQAQGVDTRYDETGRRIAA